MRNLLLVGWIIVAVGTFLPLVHIPIIGNWGYWQLDHSMAIAVWIALGFTLLGIVNNKIRMVRALSILLIFLFALTIFAIKLKAMDAFSWIPLKSFQTTLASIVKLSWAWFLEFGGALILLFASRKNSVEKP